MIANFEGNVITFSVTVASNYLVFSGNRRGEVISVSQ